MHAHNNYIQSTCTIETGGFDNTFHKLTLINIRVDLTTSFDLAEKKTHTDDKSLDTNSLPSKSLFKKKQSCAHITQ